MLGQSTNIRGPSRQTWDVNKTYVEFPGSELSPSSSDKMLT